MAVDLGERKILDMLANTDIDSKNRRKLMGELQRVSTAASVPALQASLASNDRRIRVGALFALGHVGSEAAVDVILETVGSDDGLTIAWAAHVLAKMRARRAMPVLVKYLDEKGAGLKRSERNMILGAIASMPGPAAVETLKRHAVDRSRRTRGPAARALASMGTAESREALQWATGQLGWLRGRPVRSALRSGR